MTETNKIEQDLKNANIKITGARCQILELLHNRQGHYSAEEIHSMLPDLGLATVYRTLVQLEAVGLILRHSFLDGIAVYEINDGDHGHVVCISCGNISEFDDQEIDTKQKQIANSMRLKNIRFSHTIYGVCINCQS